MCKKEEKQIISDKISEAHLDKNTKKFWKNININDGNKSYNFPSTF